MLIVILSFFGFIMHFAWKHTYPNPNICMDLAFYFSGEKNHLRRELLIHTVAPAHHRHSLPNIRWHKQNLKTKPTAPLQPPFERSEALLVIHGPVQNQDWKGSTCVFSAEVKQGNAQPSHSSSQCPQCSFCDLFNATFFTFLAFLGGFAI